MSKGSDILIVDDEVDMRLALAELLEEEGYSVAHAKDGKTGLGYLETHPAPKLILLDYMMPEMDGSEFCNILNRNASLAKIPVALVSAATISEEKLAAMSVVAYIEKPLKIDKFLDFVSDYCRKI